MAEYFIVERLEFKRYLSFNFFLNKMKFIVLRYFFV